MVSEVRKVCMKHFSGYITKNQKLEYILCKLHIWPNIEQHVWCFDTWEQIWAKIRQSPMHAQPHWYFFPPEFPGFAVWIPQNQTRSWISSDDELWRLAVFTRLADNHFLCLLHGILIVRMHKKTTLLRKGLENPTHCNQGNVVEIVRNDLENIEKGLKSTKTPKVPPRSQYNPKNSDKCLTLLLRTMIVQIKDFQQSSIWTINFWLTHNYLMNVHVTWTRNIVTAIFLASSWKQNDLIIEVEDCRDGSQTRRRQEFEPNLCTTEFMTWFP